MNYKFPMITHIDQVRKAIEGREEFIEANKGDYIVFNYLVNFEDTFPTVWNKVVAPLDGEKFLYDEIAALRRECRGIIFDAATGDVISRRYHKFFNMGEKPETQESAIDWRKPHLFLEKLDGSMIAPFRTSNMEEGFLVGTKMGVTDVAANAAEFILARPNYCDFIDSALALDLTPIFEWCSRKNRIVVDYPVDRLVLTGIRDNQNGRYASYETMVDWATDSGIEVVQTFELSIDGAKANQKIIEDEGYVVRFEDGHMLKIKGEHYLLLHKTMEHLSQEKDFIRLLLTDKMDDVMAYLPLDMVEKIDKFNREMFEQIAINASVLTWTAIVAYDKSGSKKDYALQVKDNINSGLLFKIWDFIVDLDTRDEPWSASDIETFTYDLIKGRILDNLSTGSKVDGVRHLFGGLKW